MPIRFDRYPVPRGGLPGAPSVRTLPPDTTAADAFGVVAKAATEVSGVMFAANARKAALAEKVRVGERYLTAVEEMDRQVIALQQDPETREKASERWAQWLESRREAWSKGLTSEGAAALEQKLLDKRLGYAHAARLIEAKDLEDRTNVVILGHAKRFVDAFALAGPDLMEYETAPDGSVRARVTPEFADLQEAYGHAVASTAKTKEAAAKELLGLQQEAAAAKAHAMILSTDPAAGRRLSDLLAQEKQKPGSTFLAILQPDRRNAIEKQAKDADYAQLKRQQEQTDRVRTEATRRLKEQQEAWANRTDTMLRDGSLTEAWIEDGKTLHLVEDEKARFYRSALEKRRTGEEGPNDPATFQRLGLLVYSATSDPVRVMADVEAAAGRLNWPTLKEWRAHLESRIKSNRDTAKSDRTTAQREEKQDVEKYIQILTTTRSPFEKFDPAANTLRYQLLRELGQLSDADSPKVWWETRETGAVKQMRGLASAYIRTQRDSLHIKVDQVPVEGVNVADLVAARRTEYEKKFGADARSKMVEDIKRLQDMQSLSAEIESKDAGVSSKPGPKPATPKPSAVPLKPGSRS